MAAGAAAPAAAAAVTTPEVRVGPVTVSSITVPQVTTPALEVPSLTTPVATTPAVRVPSVTTPAVTTPSVRTPAVEAPRASVPSAPEPVAPARDTTTPSPAPGAPAPAARPSATTAAREATTPVASTRRAARPRDPAPRRRERSPRAPSSQPAAATTVALRTPAGSSSPATAAPGPAAPSRGSVLPGPVDAIVDALPRWVLGVFLSFALIAMLMAVNAYLSARRARVLGAQRAALLDDVGLLQTALLAPVPAHAGDAEVSVAYRPADGPGAGGDFYDVIALGPDRTALLLGDVSGHGREALRLAALVRYTVRTFLAAGHDPADALARADDCLETDLDGDFATVIAAVYDHERHTLRYAKAGHHAPVVLGASHDPAGEPVAPPLGAGFGIHPEACELTLDAGSTLCLFTDGLIEARRDGALLGRDTLVALLQGERLDGPGLLRRIVEHADEVSDDLAVCVLRRP